VAQCLDLTVSRSLSLLDDFARPKGDVGRYLRWHMLKVRLVGYDHHQEPQFVVSASASGSKFARRDGDKLSVEIARRLTFGSNKYSMNAPPNNPPLHNNAVVRWTPRPNTNQANDANQRIFIAFGNGSWGNLRGQLPSATKRLVRRLREVSRLTGGNVVMVIQRWVPQLRH
jgi:hypothetical protein